MNASLFKLLAQQAVQYRRSQGAMWLTYFIWATVPIVLFLTLIMTFTIDAPRGVHAMWVVCLFLLVYSLWPPLIKVIPLLLTPANAQLVPGVRRGAMWMVSMVFVAVVVLGAAIIGLPNGNVIQCASLIAMGLAGLTLLGVGRMEGTVPYFGAIVITLDPAAVAGSLPYLSSAALLTSIYAFARMFPRGERHWRSMEKIEKFHRITSGQLPAASNGLSGVRRIVYGRLLARDSGRPDSTGALCWHVLGPNAHWSSLALALVLMLVLCGVAMGLVWSMRWSSTFVHGVIVGNLVAVIVFGQLIYVQQIAMRLHATRAEQELLRLTARLPQNAALNRLFVRQVLLRSAAMLAAALLLSVLASLMVEMSLASVLRGLALASLTALLSASTLRLITKTNKPTDIWPAVLMLLLMLAVGLAFILVNAVTPLPWAALAFVSFLLAGALLVRDVGMIMRGSVVLPLAHS